MGYRSDVVQAIAFDSKEKLAGFLAECKLNNVTDKDTLDCYEVKVWESSSNTEFIYVLHAQFEAVKWYDFYEDIKKHEAMLQLANDKDYPTCFIRIGEETRDIEEDVLHGGEFEFDWWGHGYAIIRSFNIDESDTTLTIQNFFNRVESNGFYEQPTTKGVK